MTSVAAGEVSPYGVFGDEVPRLGLLGNKDPLHGVLGDTESRQVWFVTRAQ